MKLDRNINDSGRGKYALINLRKNTVEFGPPATTQFFVLKYTDRFAAGALRGYVQSITEYLDLIKGQMTNEEFHENSRVRSLIEYRCEIEGEIKSAERLGTKIPD